MHSRANGSASSNLPARSSAWIFSDFCSRSELESWAPQAATSASRITAGREKRRIVRGPRMPSLAAYLTAGPHSFRVFWEKGEGWMTDPPRADVKSSCSTVRLTVSFRGDGRGKNQAEF